MELETIRHSAAHLMAAAVKKLYPETKFDIGPATDNGFYYDFDMEHRLTVEDLAQIEKAMKKMLGGKVKFERFETTREEAQKLLADQPFKLERLADIPEGESISFYRSGDFIDLCRGPHVESSAEIGAVKLLSVAGSYFRGDENNKMLQRIYGTAFATADELKEYLTRIEEAAKRDHRKLGTELDLFGFSEQIGPGLVLWPVTSLRLPGRKSTTKTVISSSIPPISVRVSSGRPVDTLTSIMTACTPPCRSMKRTTMPNL